MQRQLPVHMNTHRFGGGRPRVSDRDCADAIFNVLRTGCQWQALDQTELCAHPTATTVFKNGYKPESLSNSGKDEPLSSLARPLGQKARELPGHSSFCLWLDRESSRRVMRVGTEKKRRHEFMKLQGLVGSCVSRRAYPFMPSAALPPCVRSSAQPTPDTMPRSDA